MTPRADLSPHQKPSVEKGRKRAEALDEIVRGLGEEDGERKSTGKDTDSYRKLLETVVNHIPAAVTLIRGSDLRLQLVNPSYQSIAPEKEMVGKTLDELWPEAGQNFSALCRRVLETGEPYHVKDELNMIRRHPEGPLEAAYFSWSLHRVLLPGDEGWGLLNTAWETTERKRSEELLRESEAKYRGLFDAIDQGFFLVDVLYDESGRPTDLYYVEANAAASRMVGQDYTGRHLREIHPNFEEYWYEIFGEVARTGKSVRLQRYAEPLGRWYDFYLFRIGGPESRRIGNIFLDITESKRAEEALREAVDRYEQQVRLFDGVSSTTPDFVYIFDLQGRFLYANNRLLTVWGMELPDVIGKTCRELGYEQWHHDMHMREIAQVIQTKRPIKGEVPFKAPLTGLFGIYEYIFTPVMAPDGEVEFIAGTTRDVTERKQAEDALKEAKSAAEEASRAKSEFLANMSHEIRTPLTVFMSAIEHLLQIDQNPERRHLLGMAEHSARRLRTLIDDILDFSRIEARKVSLEEKPFALADCVRSAVELFALPAREKRLQLKAQVSLQTPETVLGDPDRLGQVLINLIGNAVKFTREGEIRVSVQPRDDFLEFEIADTGIGIPAEKIDLLFQSFSQVDSSFSRRFGGTGLGLAISKGLVELMGGNISVQSREGKGSVFTFTVPLKQGGESPSFAHEIARPEQPLKERSGRILLADDEPLIREMITMMLGQRGWQVETAETGSEAVEKWKEGEFDLILMDLQMPELSGLDATRAIRKEEEGTGRHTCIVGLTAHARQEIRDECLACGMDHALSKPIRMQELYSVVAQSLAE